MSARLLRFPPGSAPRLLVVPGRVRRFAFARMRLEVWLRVRLYRYRRWRRRL